MNRTNRGLAAAVILALSFGARGICVAQDADQARAAGWAAFNHLRDGLRECDNELGAAAGTTGADATILDCYQNKQNECFTTAATAGFARQVCWLQELASTYHSSKKNARYTAGEVDPAQARQAGYAAWQTMWAGVRQCNTDLGAAENTTDANTTIMNCYKPYQDACFDAAASGGFARQTCWLAELADSYHSSKKKGRYKAEEVDPAQARAAGYAAYKAMWEGVRQCDGDLGAAQGTTGANDALANCYKPYQDGCFDAAASGGFARQVCWVAAMASTYHSSKVKSRYMAEEVDPNRARAAGWAAFNTLKQSADDCHSNFNLDAVSAGALGETDTKLIPCLAQAQNE